MTGHRHVESREVDKVGDWARRGIWVVGTVLAAFFAFLQLSHLPYVPAIENTNPLYVRELLLALYYLCWIFGTSFDVSIQRYAYVADPQHGQMPRRALLILIGFSLVAALLLWVRESDKMFAAVLGVFFGLPAVSCG
jgi:hypothetical protein